MIPTRLQYWGSGLLAICDWKDARICPPTAAGMYNVLVIIQRSGVAMWLPFVREVRGAGSDYLLID